MVKPARAGAFENFTLTNVKSFASSLQKQQLLQTTLAGPYASLVASSSEPYSHWTQAVAAATSLYPTEMALALVKNVSRPSPLPNRTHTASQGCEQSSLECRSAPDAPLAQLTAMLPTLTNLAAPKSAPAIPHREINANNKGASKSGNQLHPSEKHIEVQPPALSAQAQKDLDRLIHSWSADELARVTKFFGPLLRHIRSSLEVQV